MVERVVKPEILDSLDAADPAAIRSRRDLRLINWFMRGEPWILQQLSEFDNLSKVVEIGAGDGHLASLVKKKFPNVEVIAVDLLDRPVGISKEIQWRSEDALISDCYDSDTVVIANLFIHHLDEDGLWNLGEKMSNCRGLITSEPHRYWFSKLLGYLIFPFVNRVTRHDMIVSIEAGFRFGELAGLMNVDWHWDERAALGGIRSIAKQIK
jgi:2-polyprenyl-3-methyl-5-hydroxy-6-metoxy-1,4-benzoquinol methylase